MFSALLLLLDSDSDSDSGTSSDADEDIDDVRKLIPREITDETFMKNFHVSRELFKFVHDAIAPQFGSDNDLPLHRTLGAILRFFATGACTSDRGVGGYVALQRSKFQRIFPQMLQVMHDTLCPQFISLNMDADEKREAERYYEQKYEIPDVVLCVVRAHIIIAPPKNDRHLFYFKDGSYSLNALLLSDHTNRFRYVNAQCCGAFHDAHVWNSTGLDDFFAKNHGEGNERFRLLGDDACPSKPWLVTPKPDAVPHTPEAKFNIRHASALTDGVQSFSLLTNRFRCLTGTQALPYSPTECVAIVNVCCALHNLCIKYNVPSID